MDISNIKLLLTEKQYERLLVLLEMIPAVFSGAPDLKAGVQAADLDVNLEELEGTPADVQTDLHPEVVPKATALGQSTSKKLSLNIGLPSVRLDLFDAETIVENDLKNHGIVCFSLNSSTMALDMRSNGALQAQAWVKSLTMTSTKAGPSKFREIIPASKKDQDQFHCLFTMSGGKGTSAQLIATVDSPNIIFSVEPIFALSNFFLGGLKSRSSGENLVIADEDQNQQHHDSPSGMKFSFRFDLYDTSVSILEDDQEADTQAIRLSLARLSFSQQVWLSTALRALFHTKVPSRTHLFLRCQDLVCH